MESSITPKESGKKTTPYVTCLVRGKPIKRTPEEAVLQLYVMVPCDDLGYLVSRMELEHEVTFGPEKKCADVCTPPSSRRIAVELSKALEREQA